MSDDEFAYLRDGFNARTLRKDQLRNILLTHDVEYTNDMLKPQLLELFQSNIVPRRAELRSKFVNVSASAANIENATPPKGERTGRVPRLEKEETAEVPESPRSRRARSRSPQRARSPARKKAEGLAKETSIKEETSKEEQDSKSKLSLKGAEMPNLAPPAPITSEEPPKSPKSPRRRRANRKVEVSESESDHDPLTVPTEDIKVKVPRSPRRKRQHEEPADADESFTSKNVFQSGKPSGKKRRAESPKASAPSYADLPSEPVHTPTHYSDAAPVTESDIGIDALPLDADFVADLNAEVDRLQRSQAEPDLQYDQDHVLQHHDISQHELQPELQSELQSELQANSTQDHQEDEQPQSYTSFAQTPSRDTSRLPSEAPSSVPSSSNATPRRRGFIPSIAELSVSRAFAEQLEPFMAPSPIPTPAQTPRVPPAGSRLRADTIMVDKDQTPTRSGSSERSTPFDFKDVEEVAAEDLHQVADYAQVNRWYHKLRLPAFHIRFPKLPLPNLKTVGAVIFIVLTIVMNSFLLGLGGMFAHWYRDSWSKAEFCGVGTMAPHTYPQWTLYDTGYPAVSTLQTTFREMMDEVWPECIACPDHARCYQDRIVLCDSGYQQSIHPLESLGLWPQPPRCLPDWEAQRKLDVLSDRAASYLREQRAQVLCDTPKIQDTDLEKASSMQSEQLKTRLFSEKSESLDDEEFEFLWQQVIEQLPDKHTDVYVVSFDPTSTFGTEDSKEEDRNQEQQLLNADGGQMLTNAQNNSPDNRSNGSDASASSEIKEIDPENTWLVSNSDALLPLKCRFRHYVAQWIQIHRKQIFYTISVISLSSISFVVISRARKERRKQRTTIEGFVNKLKQQRSLADADISGKTVPYLKAADLRSQVPKAQLKTIQDALERVEGVRMRQIEIYGEITRIWEWAP